jgi:hypothetical protein
VPSDEPLRRDDEAAHREDSDERRARQVIANDRLRPAFEQAGEGDIVPQFTFFPVYKLIQAGTEGS